MCALFHENRSGIKKSVISFVYLFCPNTGTKFREPYRSNHVIPHRVSCFSLLIAPLAFEIAFVLIVLVTHLCVLYV